MIHKLPKCFYLHIPKCGGTSLQYQLKNIYPQSTIAPISYSKEFEKLYSEDIEKYLLFAGHFDDSIRRAIRGDLISMIVLREPIKRVVSLVRYQKQEALISNRDNARDYANPLVFKNTTLEKIYKSTSSPEFFSISNFMTRLLVGGDALNAENLAKSHLESAKKNLKEYTVVGFAEDMQTVVNRVSSKLGVPCRPDIILNKTIYDEPLTSADLACIRQHNQLDLALYEFAQREVNKRTCKGSRAISKKGFDSTHTDRKQPPEFISTDLDSVGAIQGWWPWEPGETTGDNGRRWTGPDMYSVLDFFVRKDLGVTISLKVVGYLNKKDLEMVVIGADDAKQTSCLVEATDGITLSAIFHASELDLKQKTLRVSVKTKHVHVSKCGRQLGIAFSAISIISKTQSLKKKRRKPFFAAIKRFLR